MARERLIGRCALTLGMASTVSSPDVLGSAGFAETNQSPSGENEADPPETPESPMVTTLFVYSWPEIEVEPALYHG